MRLRTPGFWLQMRSLDVAYVAYKLAIWFCLRGGCMDHEDAHQFLDTLWEIERGPE